MTSDGPPVAVEVLRGDVVESLHPVTVAVAGPSGRVVASWGDPARPVFPRSAIKPVQALPLVETGALAAYGLGSEKLALATASHSGEPAHVDRVRAWLARLGLDEQDLECGAHPPANPEAAAALLRAGTAPGQLHNNCSGKHAGFLTVARHLGQPHRGYIQPDHPVQRLVTATIAALTGMDPATAWAVDGCGIPTFALPLAGLATAMARLADPSGLEPVRRAAARAIVGGMHAHPLLVAGTGRLDSLLMMAAPDIATKGGAEGVHAAILPKLGLGMALKVHDGAARAAEVALLAVLERLGALPAAALPDRRRPVVRNVAGKGVGLIRAVL